MSLFITLLTVCLQFFLFFFNSTPTTEIYTLSLHDALPILDAACRRFEEYFGVPTKRRIERGPRSFAFLRPGDVINPPLDRKSTRLNSSHTVISYAVFCLKKKKKKDSTS